MYTMVSVSNAFLKFSVVEPTLVESEHLQILSKIVDAGASTVYLAEAIGAEDVWPEKISKDRRLAVKVIRGLFIKFIS